MIKQLIINLSLFIIAIVLYIIVSPINLMFVLSKGGKITDYLLSTATTIDKVAGWEFRTFWNRVLIKGDNKQEFNDIRFTMSYFLGVNKERKTLTKFGVIICIILNALDKDHVEKAVKSVREKFNTAPH